MFTDSSSIQSEPIVFPLSQVEDSTFYKVGYSGNLIFIDSGINNFEDIVANVNENANVYIIDGSTDGVVQISETLSEYSNVESLEIYSHGSSGSLNLGTAELNINTLGKYHDQLSGWSGSFTDKADILIYGCEFAKGDEGVDFVNKLSDLTQTDFAASTDLTGSTALGGDWELEYKTGTIETLPVFDSETQSTLNVLLNNDWIVDNDPNFQNEAILTGLDDPISMEWLPDGRALILEKNGVVKISNLNDAVPSASVFMTLPDVGTAAERGLMDVAIDPDFENNGYFYLYYTLGSENKFQLSRFESQGNTGDLSSEFVLWQDPNKAGSPDHYGGGLDFGPDGKLYLSFGDKGFSAPERAQDLTRYEGKVLRFNPDGTIPTDNPFVNDPNNPNALPEIWAYGLRNPFRANWDFESNSFFIGDVGFDSWEEINRVGINEGGANFGWNDYEGYTGGVPGVTDPVYAYSHPGGVGGAAVIGGSIYRGDLFPAEFYGAYFFLDFVQDWVQYVQFDASGDVIDADPTTTTIDAFKFDSGSRGTKIHDKMVFIDQGPDGALYLASILRGEIRRITYNDPNGNSPPVIDEQATVATLQGGLTVGFTGIASDPDPNATLTYLWNFGDGNSSTEVNPTHVYASNGEYTATLSVSDGEDQDIFILDPIVLGLPPTANISLFKDENFSVPFVDGVDLFQAGDTIYFQGIGVDPDGTLDESSYNWDIRFLHDEHFHPEVNDYVGSTGSFQITTTEHGFTSDFLTGFEFVLTVTDSDGLSVTNSTSAFPQKVNLTFTDNLVGDFSFDLDGFSQISSDTNPFEIETAVNFQHEATAPLLVTVNGIEYVFDSWSNGETSSTLTLSSPVADQTYVANYIVNDPNPDPEPPVALLDNFNITAGSSTNSLNVLANDTDPDPGDTLLIIGLGATDETSITTINGSTVAINGSGNQLVYTPGTSFIGSESFTYKIVDSTGFTSTATVTIDVNEAADLPDGLVLQLDAGVGVTTNGGDLVTGWIDQSGTGNDLSSIGDPRLINDVLNGRDVIRLDGDGDKLERLANINLPSGNADRTVFLVANYDGIGDGGFSYGTSAKDKTFGVTVGKDGDLKVKAWGNAGDADSNVDGTGQGWLSQSVLLSGGVMSHFKDGTLIDTKAHTYNTTLDRIILGADIDSSPYVDMDVAEVLVFDRALSAAELQQVEAYLQVKYFGEPSGGGNSNPVAVADNYAVDLNSTSNSLDLLGNDTDADQDTLTITAASNPTNGTAAVTANGNSVVYTPDPGYVGTDIFTYTIIDGNGGIAQGTVTIEVEAPNINDAPVAEDDIFSVGLDSGANVLSVLANDSDADITDGNGIMNFNDYSIIAAASNGKPQQIGHVVSSGGLDDVTFVIDATNAGGITPHFHQPQKPPYLTQHNMGGNGEQLEFTLARQDGLAFSFESFSYTSGLQFPDAGNLNGGFIVFGTTATGGTVSQSFTPATTPGTFQTAILTGAGWDNLTSVRFVGGRVAQGADMTQELNIDDLVVASPALTIAGITGAVNGTATIAADGRSIDYTPNVGFVGTETFSYTVDDGNGLADTATVTVNVAEPTALPSGIVLHLDAGIGVTTNGSDLVTGWEDQSGTGNDLSGLGDPRLVSGALNGHNVIRLDGDGDKLERLANINLPSGNADRTIFLIANYDGVGDGGFAYGTGAKDKTFGLTVGRDGDLKVKAWGRTGDADSNLDGTGQGWLSQSVLLSGGVMTHYKDGTQIDTKTHTYNTTLDRIILGADIDSSPYVDMDVAEVLVFDRALSEAERLQVEVYLQQKYFGSPTGGGNIDPVAGTDDYTVALDSANNTLDVLANDTDANGDLLTVTSATDPANGTVSVAANGSDLSYTPDSGFLGTDTFTYTLDDNNGGTVQGTVTIEVEDPNANDAPIAVDDSFSITPDSIDNIFNVLANDSDAEQDPLSLTAVDNPINGTATILANSVVYTPDLGFVGIDTFNYTVDDGNGGTDIGTVTVNVVEPSVLPNGLVLQLDASAGVTTDGADLVTNWADQSISGNNLSGVGDPRLVPGVLNGRDVIRFDGDGDKLERLVNVNLPSGNADRTVFMVANYDGIGDGGFSYGTNAKDKTFGLTVGKDGDLKIKAWGREGDADSDIDGTGQGWLLQSVVLSAGVMTHYKDGIQIDTKTHNYNTTLDQIVVGADIDSNPYLDMDIAEVLVFDRALSEVERLQVEAYFQLKYFGG